MNITATRSLGRSGPVPALEIYATLKWYQPPAFLLGVSGNVACADRMICDNVWFERVYWPFSDSTYIAKDEYNYQVKFVVPLDRSTISFIEENRRDQDVSLNLSVHYLWQEVIDVPATDKNQAKRIGGMVHNDKAGLQGGQIGRSDWLKRLAEMGWQEYEVFEIAKQPLLPDENLTVALKRVEEAQAALRNGDHSGVLAKCRSALESAAKYESAGDVKKGFAALLSRAFENKDTVDAKKQSALNDLITKLSDYAHLGRHEQYPAVHVGREEAEFIFATTVSLFSLLSRLMAKE